MRKIILLLALTIGCIAANAQEHKYKTEKDIIYRSVDEYAEKMCRMDIAHPEGAEQRPVIVWFHGGGLTGGWRHIPQELLRDGAVVVGVGYRFSPHVPVTQIIDDAACAIAWVMDNISKYGGNPDKIFISGHSAGGYLVTMVGLDKSRLAKYDKDADTLAGIIPFSGQAITHFEERRSRGIADKQPIVDSLAPLYHVRGDAAPILILSGDRELEMLGRYEENAYFWRMLRLAGDDDATIYEFDGYGHGMCEPGYPLLLEFIHKH
jgi:acetyl esterase/lipase